MSTANELLIVSIFTKLLEGVRLAAHCFCSLSVGPMWRSDTNNRRDQCQKKVVKALLFSALNNI